MRIKTNVVYVVVFSDLDLITGVCQEGQIGRGLSYGSVYKQTISRQVILSSLHMDGVSTTSLQVSFLSSLSFQQNFLQISLDSLKFPHFPLFFSDIYLNTCHNHYCACWCCCCRSTNFSHSHFFFVVVVVVKEPLAVYPNRKWKRKREVAAETFPPLPTAVSQRQLPHSHFFRVW